MTSTADLSVFCAVGAVWVLGLKHFLQFDIRLRYLAEILPISGDFSRKCCLLSFLPNPTTAALRLRLTAHHSLVWGNEEFEAELTPNIEQETDFKCWGLNSFLRLSLNDTTI